MRAPARCLVGVDEAGRGSFVGPLVVGGFAIDPDRVEELRSAGVRDSKELAPRAREEVHGRLAALGRWAVAELDPRIVDQAVARGRLNQLEAQAFGRLIRDLGADEAHVDACDVNEQRFARSVARSCGPGIRVHARHHADRDDLVVGAASIVAKVRRDARVAELRAALGADFGSGYPSDERTVEFVRAHLENRGETPTWLRASWATMARVKVAPPAVRLEEFES
jgi:ribonuclease HII